MDHTNSEDENDTEQIEDDFEKTLKAKKSKKESPSSCSIRKKLIFFSTSYQAAFLPIL